MQVKRSEVILTIVQSGFDLWYPQKRLFSPMVRGREVLLLFGKKSITFVSLIIVFLPQRQMTIWVLCSSVVK